MESRMFIFESEYSGNNKSEWYDCSDYWDCYTHTITRSVITHRFINARNGAQFGLDLWNTNFFVKGGFGPNTKTKAELLCIPFSLKERVCVNIPITKPYIQKKKKKKVFSTVYSDDKVWMHDVVAPKFRICSGFIKEVNILR